MAQEKKVKEKENCVELPDNDGVVKNDSEPYRRTVLNQLTYNLAKDMYSATPRDKFNAIVLSVRAKMVKDHSAAIL
jgi:hypothetical protein